MAPHMLNTALHSLIKLHVRWPAGLNSSPIYGQIQNARYSLDSVRGRRSAGRPGERLVRARRGGGGAGGRNGGGIRVGNWS